MDENIKKAWNLLAMELRPLTESWPPKLVFINTPTTASLAYIECKNYLRPNDGPCSLDSSDPSNKDFLRIQTFIAQNIDLYQNFNSELEKQFLADLRNAAEGLEEIKRNRWEQGRRTYYIGMVCVCIL